MKKNTRSKVRVLAKNVRIQSTGKGLTSQAGLVPVVKFHSYPSSSLGTRSWKLQGAGFLSQIALFHPAPCVRGSQETRLEMIAASPLHFCANRHSSS
uniref:Uncharacterized protein n=1 Tax=Candidatus Kentrum sp. LPFa TaxID=2126335 RepID=A0A450XS76_9GAMM|nr:MAG: hypothetical protein BECKLPF1236C_GA0070990_101587 [Candidatus Kentron sp. LPFa]